LQAAMTRTRTTDITSFTEHRQHLREHLNRVNETGRPLYITRDGRPEAVVLSAAAYDELADRADLQQTLVMIQRSEADTKAGRVREARASRDAIVAKHGLTPEA
jgi:prevent-host-death family protein